MAGMDVVVGEDGLARPAWADGRGAHGELLRHYYDTEWGMPVRDERGLFERLSLEAFQSGLSWATILAKREAFRSAFAGFDPDVVARYGDDDVERLMADASIVRNRAKIEATIANAAATVALRRRAGLAEAAVGGPIALLKNGDRYRTVDFDYHDGLRYPRLERIEGAPDRLSDILAPRRR